MPGEFDAPIHKALDDYELMRRKAKAFDDIAATSLLPIGERMEAVYEIVGRVLRYETRKQAGVK